MKLLSSTQIKEWDQYTIQNEPISSIDLMERASQTFVHWFISIYKDTNTPVDIFCGNGNNGGDGLAIARLLRDRFYVVSVHVLKFAKHDSLDFEINLKRVKLQSEIKLHFINEVIPQVPESSIIIDSLMGIGINKPVNGELKDLIKAINQLPNKKISVDIPSGLPSEGSAIGETICPDFIYTFQLPKISFFMQDNYAYCPSWVVGDIHLNPIFLSNVVTNCYLMDHNLIRSLYKIRQKFQHKGSFGHAMIIAGSKGKIGAAILATKACLRSGGGLVTVCIPEIGVEIIHETIPEAMVLSTGFQCLNSCPEHLDDYTLGIGPGLGMDHKTIKALSNILYSTSKPIVIDADALNIIANQPTLLDILPKNSILTPHPREFERLFGKTNTESQRLAFAKAKAKKYQIFIILKGAQTRIFTPDGIEYINTTGNPGMATAGSGDVLTGILTGLLSQKYTPLNAAILGVYLHGLAADLALEVQSQESLLATDIISYLGKAYKTISPL